MSYKGVGEMNEIKRQICKNCGNEFSVYECVCPCCNYSAVFHHILDETEQLCIQEMLEQLDEPFLITSEDSVQGYEKIYIKTIGGRYILDEKPREEILTSLEDFSKNYPELEERRMVMEIRLIDSFIEEADNLGGNALIGVNFNLVGNREKQICLRAVTQVFHITAIKKEEVMTEEKFQKIYRQVEREYKNHNLNQDIYYGIKNYNMAVRIIRTLEDEKLDADAIKLAALLYGIRQQDYKLFAYYGDPEFVSAEEYLEYQGVPEKLCRKVKILLKCMKYESLEKFKFLSGDANKNIPDSLFESLEWKVLRDIVQLSHLGALGIANVIHNGGMIYDPWFFWIGDLDEYPFAISNLTMIQEYCSMENDFYTEEAKKIGKKRCGFMRRFIEEYKTEADAEDK